MNIENLNQALAEIAKKKFELSKIEGQPLEFEKLKHEIDQLEESLFVDYKSFIEEILFNVYDEYCPDNEVLSPLAYIASSYLIRHENGRAYFDVDANEGVLVDADDFPGIKVRLVLVPDPVRLILQGERGQFREVVWSSRQLLEA